MMIPSVGEQDTADIQEHAGNFSRFFHRLFSVDAIIVNGGFPCYPVGQWDTNAVAVRNRQSAYIRFVPYFSSVAVQLADAGIWDRKEPTRTIKSLPSQ